tara:strand:+ start:41416 stop:41595 length:180 start_codon:yes stop_codon:yes gene_type:complete
MTTVEPLKVLYRYKNYMEADLKEAKELYGEKSDKYKALRAVLKGSICGINNKIAIIEGN